MRDMDIIYKTKRTVVIDGVSTTLIKVYSNPYYEQWNQYDCSTNINKNDKTPVMHTAHTLPVDYKDSRIGIKITRNSHTYIKTN